jgi:hypothetical protein
MGLEYTKQPQFFENSVTVQGVLSSVQLQANALISSTARVTEISAVSLSGTFYGDGTKLGGVFSNQSTINAFLTSLSSKPFYPSLSVTSFSANNVFAVSGVFTNIVATSLSGTFYGDGTKLAGVYSSQGAINTFVVNNSADSKLNSLSAKFINTEYVGNPLFRTLSSSVITTNTLNSATTFSGVYYGDGRNLQGIFANQNVINSTVAQLTGDAVVRTLSAVSGAFINISATSLSGTFYGDGSNLLGVTTGGRRFFYETIGNDTFTYSGSTPFYTTSPSASAWKIVKVQYSLDGGVVGLSARNNVPWTNRATLIYYP